jgi:curved DNA-binding protein CbpA
VAGQRHDGMVFGPADLQEDVDLDVEQRREILATLARLEGADHWQVLGVPWNAPAGAVRAAYLEQVKAFHPDRYPGQRLGSFRARLEAIFRRLTEARDALSDDGARAAYAARTAPPEEVARAEARRLQDEQRSRERRARLARSHPVVARGARAREMLERGRRQLEEDRPSAALNDLLTALAMDPTLAEARALAEEARRRSSAEKARDLSDRARAAEMVGNLDLAQELAGTAATADPANPRFSLQAARVALRRGALQVARGHAEAAVRIAPTLAVAHEALGEILLAAGDRAAARKALERAVDLDGKLESAREQLKKLRWSLFR